MPHPQVDRRIGNSRRPANGHAGIGEGAGDYDGLTDQPNGTPALPPHLLVCLCAVRAICLAVVCLAVCMPAATAGIATQNQSQDLSRRRSASSVCVNMYTTPFSVSTLYMQGSRVSFDAFRFVTLVTKCEGLPTLIASKSGQRARGARCPANAPDLHCASRSAALEFVQIRL